MERIEDGEVSPYLTDELRAGDELELRGPVGGHFTWRVEQGGPLLLVAGGSGLVPLMAMLRHRAARGSDVDARLLVSARRWEDLLYRDELAALADRGGLRVHYTLTRAPAARLDGLGPPRRRRDAGRRRPGARRAPAGVRLRADGVRRERGRRADLARPPGGGHPHGAIRTDRRMR